MIDIIAELTQLREESIPRRIPIIEVEKAEWLLNQIKALKPKRILELGTANGYSGCVLGSEGAELVTLEQDPKVAEEAMKNFKDFNINALVIIGDAIEEVEKLVESKRENDFNLIFIDIFIKDYHLVLDNCIRLCSENGTIIFDNINNPKGKEFKKQLMNHPKLKTEIIEIGDGVSISHRF
jgi:predicted O-methyltransferase YrrM